MSLEEMRTHGSVSVRCKICKIILVQEDTVTSDCKHFRWEIVTAQCFHRYFAYPECNAEKIEKLRKKYLVRVIDGERYFLLVRRGVDEE